MTVAPSLPAPFAPVAAELAAPFALVVAELAAPFAPVVAELAAPVAPLFTELAAPLALVVAELTAPFAPVVAELTAPVAPVVAELLPPLASFFDNPVFSYRVGHVKPDREIYNLACRELDVDPDCAAFVGDCGGVGDGGGNELSGADEAGLHPYWASWFIDRWPEWRRDQDVYKRAHAWPRLKSARQVVDLVQAK